ncbi:glycine cleavage T C-terminal barrel domain-containing protein [Jannaschia seohaensis]|uniref:Aminomethyltransferase n=1 Tax=Jannaschia seohaensis TaxID=475081 RepID=A0A2Y9B0C2_9RHOB|nr:glycine cleavage T C-terminal barrel domain-containing protein [Jannaschia seohaensis]PWJ14987.1 aminomethyltransferase [Jannaschia seohaensis]SSA49836.1 aminomethyltransferase [Jannaschia seohaensis]
MMTRDRTHPNVPQVDQSDRLVPRNLRQSGPTPVQMLISTRVRKSPFWHLSIEAGCWRATVYNRMYHPRGFVRPEDGGAMAEYDALVNRVTLWDVAVERQIRVRGADAEAFVNRVVTRDVIRIAPMRGRYVIVCNAQGGIVNDPVLLRLAEDEFWFSASDSDLMLWLQGVNVGLGYDVAIDELDVAPLQIQGPLSEDFMTDLFGQAIHDLPYYGLIDTEIAGCSVLVSQTGFSGEKGYEIFVRDASLNAEAVWYAVRGHGARYGLRVIAPAHHRRIAAGILSWGQDMDAETSPFQLNLAYQVPREKAADYIGRAALERARAEIEAGRYPFKLKMVGLAMGGAPITDYAPDFWLISAPGKGRVGYVTSPWWSPELGHNIALGFVPYELTAPGTRLKVELPEAYTETSGQPVEAEVVDVPFRPSAHPSERERARAKARDDVR